jgi:hypothetical protein
MNPSAFTIAQLPSLSTRQAGREVPPLKAAAFGGSSTWQPLGSFSSSAARGAAIAAVCAASLSRMVQRRQHRSRRVAAKSAATGGQKEQTGQYANLVAENRMITIEESNLRYAGALVIFLIGVYKYYEMYTAGVFDYNSIAANAAGAWILFETGRQSI